MSDSPQRGEVHVSALGAGRYLIADGSRRRVAFAAIRSGVTWVFLDGRVHVIQTAIERRASRVNDDTALIAPMPATVVSVNITPGQRVSAGDVMIVLEAMKMELPVKAPREATVKAVHCRPGELVQPGVLLVELE